MNAVDGASIFPSASVQSGYRIDRQVVRVQVANKEADVKLLVGSSDVVNVKVDKSGHFDMEVSPGTYACHASMPGFYTSFDASCVVEISSPRVVALHHDMVLCPYLNPGHGRFILTWNEAISDMDLLLDAPDGNAQCTISWKNRGCQSLGGNENRIHLDMDVTTGYGPETITVEGFIPGEYVVHAKHFRGFGCVNKRTNFDECLAKSHAVVSFYMDMGQYRWEVGKHGYVHDINWVIAKIDGATRKVTMCTPQLCPPINDPADAN
jgi:hypothetical protein